MTATKLENKVTDLDTARSKLAQMRDQLKLQMHLAEADMRDEWIRLESEWKNFEAKVRGLQRETRGTAEVIWEDVRELARDLERGYDRIRRSI